MREEKGDEREGRGGEGEGAGLIDNWWFEFESGWYQYRTWRSKQPF